MNSYIFTPLFSFYLEAYALIELEFAVFFMVSFFKMAYSFPTLFLKTKWNLAFLHSHHLGMYALGILQGRWVVYFSSWLSFLIAARKNLRWQISKHLEYCRPNHLKLKLFKYQHLYCSYILVVSAIGWFTRNVVCGCSTSRWSINSTNIKTTGREIEKCW